MNTSEPVSGQCDVSSLVSAAECRTTEAIKSHPGLSMLVVYGVGVGIGALLGELAPFGRPSARSETMSERIGRQVCDALHIKF